jgi:hypothetical protein
LDGLSLFAQLYHAPGHAGQRATPSSTAVLEGIDAFRSEQRFCPSTTLLKATDASGNARRKDRSYRQAAPVRRPTCERGTQRPAPATFGERIAGRAGGSACGIHLWDAGDSALKDERRAPHRRCSKRCSQAANESRREQTVSEEAQTSQLPQTSTTGSSGHHPLLKDNKRIKAVQRLWA